MTLVIGTYASYLEAGGEEIALHDWDESGGLDEDRDDDEDDNADDGTTVILCSLARHRFVIPARQTAHRRLPNSLTFELSVHGHPFGDWVSNRPRAKETLYCLDSPGDFVPSDVLPTWENF